MYNGNKVTGECVRYRDKDGKITTSSNTLTSTGKTFDMLSVFYYLRMLDFKNLSPEQPVRINMFSGSKMEFLTIKYVGKQKVKMRDKTEVEGFHIRFNFTTKGKKKSSDDIDTWISTDESHVPLLLIGKLPIGQVKCYLVSR